MTEAARSLAATHERHSPPLTLVRGHAGARRPTPPARRVEDGLAGFVRRSRHGVLSAPEEVELGRRVANGRLAERTLRTSASLPDDVRRALVQRVHDGRMAFEEFARHNIRLVASIAARYRWGRGAGLDFDDLMQEGYLGLHRAIERWDHTRGLKFSTYASWWIRQAMQRAIASKSRTVRLPDHVDGEMRNIRRAEYEAVSAGLDVTPSRVAALAGVDEAQVRRRWRWRDPVESLDRLVTAGDELGDVVADPESSEPEVVVERMLRREAIDGAIQCLSTQEAEIIRRRFGFDGPRETLEQIGASFGLSRERIRQIESRALTRLVEPMQQRLP